MSNELSRDDLEAIITLRREKGSEYDDALVDSLMVKLDAAVHQRTAAAVEHHNRPPVANQGQLALAITSLALGIPLTAIAGSLAGFVGVLVA